MPSLQILIKNTLIEEITLQLQGKLLEHRTQEVQAGVDYLRHKYRGSLFIHSCWEIRIVGLESKMNGIKERCIF